MHSSEIMAWFVEFRHCLLPEVWKLCSEYLELKPSLSIIGSSLPITDSEIGFGFINAIASISNGYLIVTSTDMIYGIHPVHGRNSLIADIGAHFKLKPNQTRLLSKIAIDETRRIAYVVDNVSEKSRTPNIPRDWQSKIKQIFLPSHIFASTKLVP